MVAQLLRLKLTLLRNTFRRKPLQLIGVLLAVVYGLGFTIMIVGGLLSLRLATADIAHSVVSVFGAVVVLAFLLLPLAFGVDDTIDPRRFALFGIPTSRLSLGLAVAALLSIPSVAVILFSLAQIATWSRGPLPTVVAVISAVLIVSTCVVAARVSAGIAGFFLASRRARDVTGILLIALLAVAGPLIALLATIDWPSRGLPIIRRIAAFVGWTPLGAAWSAPGDAALDHGATAVAKLAIAAAFLALLWLAWRALVAHLLVTEAREAKIGNYVGLGWFALLPATPTGAIAARSLSYWSRDARYRVSLAVIPVVPIVMVVTLVTAGVPWPVIAWIPVPIMAMFLGWTAHNDVAHDGTAFWTHVSANTSGVADRLGRLAPALFVGIPLVLVGSLVTVALSGQWQTLPGLIGLSACILFVGLGISSVISGAFPYPAVRPGDSPFAQPAAVGSAGLMVQSLSLFLTVLSTAPVILLTVLAGFTGPGWYWAALVVGLAVGLAVLYGGVRLGGRVISRRAPELLAFTRQN